MRDDVKLADYCRELVAELLNRDNDRDMPRRDSTSHIDEQATLADHLLTTSALVACLAYDDANRDLLRLTALVHDMPKAQQQAKLGTYADAVAPWIELLEQQKQAIERNTPVDIPTTRSERALLLAHLAASRRKSILERAEFESHPLSQGGQVALIYGGATKIKDYVFESVKLSEIRGASILLDHINQLDLPAMWGRLPTMTNDSAIREEQHTRYKAVRDWFADHFLMQALDAPECIIYASGGNILALAPANWGERLATAIEYRYTHVTKVANSVGVSRPFSLLELQYGCHPTKFWIDDAELFLKNNSDDAATLMRQSLGCRQNEHRIAFERKKGFGELVTVLAGLANRRRAGDGTHTGAYRFTSFVALSSHARKCMSCDVRPAAEFMGEADGRYLCAACHEKYQAGRWAKKSDLPRSKYKWIRPWGTWLEEQAAKKQQYITVNKTAEDLQEIGQLSDNFVGFISADGNDVGAYIAKLTSISGYRNFSKKMLEANEEAVADALIEYVEPADEQNEMWGFEVIAIGGDDVILFVPADKAVEVANHIAEKFDEGLTKRGINKIVEQEDDDECERKNETKKKENKNITLSAGVLIMPQSTPVRFAKKLADDLLDSSKKIRHDKKLAGVSIGATVDFMALKSVTMIAETIKLYREVALERKGRQYLRLTQRPYTLKQLDKLLKATRALKAANFPRSQLYQLAHYIREGLLMRSAVDYAYLVQRGKERSSSKEAFDEFDKEMIKLCCGNNWLPWRKSTQHEVDYDSPLLDIIELYPFITRKEEGEAA